MWLVGATVARLGATEKSDVVDPVVLDPKAAYAQLIDAFKKTRP